ncbi:MAG: hypothetical protein B7Z79_10500 [Thiomonas sp. 20-64-9]|nr:MAG: hypothetical protein B7Z79_10500 [Thiomonas sp. 20-64-9]
MSQPPSGSAKQLPASVRKQLMVARIAVERVEFVQAVEEFRMQARPAHMVRQALSGALLGTMNPVASMLRAFSFTRSHPYVGSILGSGLSFLLRKRLSRAWLLRLLKLGLAGGAVYGAILFLRKDAAPD